MRIFGREPAVILAFIATVIKLVAAFWIELTADQQAVLNAAAAAIVGLAIAAMVRDGIVAAVLGLAQAALALGIGFGLTISAEDQAVIMAFVGTAVSMFVRTQVVAPQPAPVSVTR